MNPIDACRAVLRDPDRKRAGRILTEALHSALLEREVPIFYFTSLLHKRSTGDYRKYVGRRRIHRVQRGVFTKGPDAEILEDKTQFAKHMQAHQIPSPRILARSNGTTIISDGRLFASEDPIETVEYLRSLCGRSVSGLNIRRSERHPYWV